MYATLAVRDPELPMCRLMHQSSLLKLPSLSLPPEEDNFLRSLLAERDQGNIHTLMHLAYTRF